MAESWRGGGTLIFNFSTTSTSLAWLGSAWLGSGSHSCQGEGEAENEREREGEAERGGVEGAIWAAR